MVVFFVKHKIKELFTKVNVSHKVPWSSTAYTRGQVLPLPNFFVSFVLTTSLDDSFSFQVIEALGIGAKALLSMGEVYLEWLSCI